MKPTTIHPMSIWLESWQDLDGKSHKAYAVRSNGDRGFMVLNTRGNYVVQNGFNTRQEAYDWMGLATE
jgi:hypothetical protein